jgi:hypothetical protein
LLGVLDCCKVQPQSFSKLCFKNQVEFKKLRIIPVIPLSPLIVLAKFTDPEPTVVTKNPALNQFFRRIAL